MTIAFDSIPANLRIPFTAVEFNSSNASRGPALLAYKALIIGQKTTAGSGTADTVAKVTREEDVIALAGRGSLLHRQSIGWFAANQSTEVWIGILDDDGSGVLATKTITVAGAATADGVLALYLGGKRLAISVTSGDSVTDVADAITAAITADLDLPVTCANTLGAATVTAKNDGTHGNDFDIRINYNESDETPAGIAVAVAAGVTGAANPALTNLLDALGDVWYNVIAHPYTDATNLTALENFLTLRNGPTKMIDGLAITSAAGTHAALTSLGNGRNNRHSCIQAQPGKNPLTPPSEYAAEHAGLIAFYGAIDPARPFQTLGHTHAVPPADVDLFDNDERNLLLFDGIGTSKVIVGKVQIERPVTTYQTNAAGAADVAYLDSTTLLTLMYLRYSFRNRMQTKYPRHKLASDSKRIAPGQKIMTPKLGRAEALAWFRSNEQLGLVENYEQFKADLLVLRNETDRNRLDFLLPPDLMNSLIVSAAQIAFRL